MLLEWAEFADIELECRLGGYTFCVSFGVDGAGVETTRKPPQPCAFFAVTSHEIVFIGPLQIADQSETISCEFGGVHRADAEYETDWPGRQKRDGLGLAKDCKAPWLVEVGCNFRKEFIGG